MALFHAKTGDSRRLCLALWVLLAPAALGAPLELAPIERAPIQLSLAFAPALSAATLPSAAALTSLPALASVAILPTATVPTAAVAATPLAAVVVTAAPGPFSAAPVAPADAAHWSAMPPAVAAAFRSGDAREFWEACRAADFAPPESDDAQQNLLHEGAILREADRLALARFAPRAPVAAPAPTRARATKIDYAAFGRALALRSGLSTDIFRDSAAKRAILKAGGYTRLYASGGRRIAIDDASDARVGRAFAATLRAYRNQ